MALKLIGLLVLISFNGISQNWIHLNSKQDTLTRKYGFVDSMDNFVINPQFDEVRNFASEYTSVRLDTLWGIIDSKGKFKIQPKYSRISVVYRNHFLESGENIKFRSIKGKTIYEYLYIPGPFEDMENIKNDSEFMKIEDYDLIVRVLAMMESRKPCHYYELFRIYNWIAIDTEKFAKMTIDFVLNNRKKVVKWIKQDKEFEKAFERGEIDCCGQGPIWWGK